MLGEIAARTDGVPLFVEELTKAVLEAGAGGGRSDAAVPASLHASLMARLDRVPGVKEVAQAAACIGREFAYPLLAAVSPVPEPELRAALDRLAAAELVFARGEPPEASLRLQARAGARRRPREPAQGAAAAAPRPDRGALEERFPETAAAEPELLARHYAEAGLAEPAVKHWQRAAELAIGRSANIEAIAHCDQAEAELRALPPSSERARAELEVQLAKGVAVRAAKGFSAPEMEPLFLAGVRALRASWGPAPPRLRAPGAVGVVLRGRALAGRGPVRGAAGRGSRHPPRRRRRHGARLRHRHHPAVPRGPGRRFRRLQRALSLYDEGDREAHLAHSGFDAPSLLCVHLALAQWLCGLPDQARRTSDQGLAIARVVGRPLSLSGTLTFGRCS